MENEKKPAATEKITEQEVKKDDVPDLKSSPYFDYNNLEDSKMRDYGRREGHQEPKLGPGRGVTDAPTPSGSVGCSGGAASSDLSSTGAINRQGVP